MMLEIWFDNIAKRNISQLNPVSTDVTLKQIITWGNCLRKSERYYILGLDTNPTQRARPKTDMIWHCSVVLSNRLKLQPQVVPRRTAWYESHQRFSEVRGVSTSGMEWTSQCLPRFGPTWRTMLARASTTVGKMVVEVDSSGREIFKKVESFGKTMRGQMPHEQSRMIAEGPFSSKGLRMLIRLQCLT